MWSAFRAVYPDVFSCEVFAFGRMYAQNPNPVDVIIIRINLIASAYDALRVNERAAALSNFRFFSYLSMAPAKCRSSFGRCRCLRIDLRNVSDIVFERRVLRRTIGD